MTASREYGEVTEDQLRREPVFHLTIVRPNGQEIEQDFPSDQIVIGRHEKADLRLIDGMVSRNHCLIFREGKRFLVKDLQSRNGTWLNGRRLKNRGAVKNGDAIQVGPFRLVFCRSASGKTPCASSAIDLKQAPHEEFSHKQEAEKVVKPLRIISDYLNQEAEEPSRRIAAPARDTLNRNLLTLYKITEELVIKKNLDEILDHILDQIFDIFSPSQSIILLTQKQGPPIPVKRRHGEGKDNSRSVSQTIINRVLKERVGILTDNALEDPRFENGDSVIIDGIRSVMAAPIWEDREILGVLYVDSLDFITGYQSEDLDLLTAIGHQTALAIQRSRLTEKLQEEAVANAVIRRTLGRFHSPQVVDQILSGNADLETKETVATIFFCDIVDFTSLCEKSSPADLQRLLNLFCGTVSEIIFEEQGTLDKFIGDAALTIFGAPLPQEDAPLRAIRSAVKIRDRLATEMKRLPAHLRFQVRYGIDTGPAIVGNFGSADRMDYTVLGHAVNLAARISKAAAPDQVLIGSGTYEAVATRKELRLGPPETKRLKGVKGVQRLYTVEGMDEDLWTKTVACPINSAKCRN
jgi:adenylate cyclase